MLIENLEVAVQSSDEVKILDFIFTPKSSSETPAISEGLELSLVISARLKRDPRGWLVPALRADVCVVVIADSRKHVVRSAVLGVEIDGPFAERPGLEAAQHGVRVVVLGEAVRHERASVS